MAAGTVISGGFPGRVAQEVNPNQKCGGCLHYDGQAGRVGACTIGLRPWLCGDGEMAEVGYAPLARGGGAYLPDMSNHDAQAPEVETQFVSEMYGAGSTRPVQVQQVSLGEEHVHFIKSMVADHTALQRSMCRLCNNRNAIGTAPSNFGVQVCTCEPIAARDVAKALAPRLNNLQRSVMSLDDVVAFVYDVAKAGFKTPLEKATFYHPSGRYDVTPAGNGKGEHHVDFHPHGGGQTARVGTFESRGAARRGAEAHAQRFAVGSNSTGTAKPSKTVVGGPDAKKRAITFSGAHQGDTGAHPVSIKSLTFKPHEQGGSIATTHHGDYELQPQKAGSSKHRAVYYPKAGGTFHDLGVHHSEHAAGRAASAHHTSTGSIEKGHGFKQGDTVFHNPSADKRPGAGTPAVVGSRSTETHVHIITKPGKPGRMVEHSEVQKR